MLKYLKILVCLVCPLGLLAQQNKYDKKKEARIARKKEIEKWRKKEEEGSLVFNKQGIFGLKLNTDGFGLMYEHTKFKTITKANSWFVELGERRDKRERRTSTEEIFGVPTGNSYIYGKVDNFYYLRFGFGQQRLLGNKGTRNGIAITAHYFGGVSFALMKPYYLQVYNPLTSKKEDVKYGKSENTDSLFFDPRYIVGASAFGTGFGEIAITPGLQTRASLRFDWDKFNDVVSALEVGINAEFYAKKLKILAFTEPNQFFFNAYVALVFGSRKLK